jgi:hypothetical protein
MIPYRPTTSTLHAGTPFGPVNDLIRTPDVDSLAEATERAPLSLLAAAALCARNAIIVEHRDVFECPIDGGDDEHSRIILRIRVVADSAPPPQPTPQDVDDIDLSDATTSP